MNATRVAAVALACALVGGLAPAYARITAQTAAGPVDPTYPGLGDHGYRARHYTVRVTYGLHSHRLTGTTTIRARATSDLTSFDLDLRLATRSVKVDGKPAHFSMHDGKLTVTPAQPITDGTSFTTRVRYAGLPARIHYPEAGYGWMRTPDGALVAGEPWAASSWFPSNDHPTQKAPFDIFVTTAARKQVVSNGVLVSRRHAAHRRTRWHWRMKRPMATYLAYLEIGDFTFERGHSKAGVPYLYAISKHLGTVRKAAVTSLRRTPRIIDFYARKFGRYPFPSVGGTLANARFPFSLENQGRPQYSKEFFDYGTNDGVIAHELGHMWFGDEVSLERWSDIWLNEGFAQWSEWLWEDHSGEIPMRDNFENAWYGESTPGFWSIPIGEPTRSQMFNWAIYDRGAMTLAALRRVIGSDHFFTLLRTWVRRHRYGNATTEQFEALAEQISGRDLTSFFDVWLRTTKKPAATAANGVPPGLD